MNPLFWDMGTRGAVVGTGILFMIQTWIQALNLWTLFFFFGGGGGGGGDLHILNN